MRILYALVFFMLFLVVLGALNEKNSQEAERQHPSCKSQWRLCSSNKELVENYIGINAAVTACKNKAINKASYGNPVLPDPSFQSYVIGDGYVKSGVAVLIEKRAQFSNMYGAMVNTMVRCSYDLNTDTVLDAELSP